MLPRCSTRDSCCCVAKTVLWYIPASRRCRISMVPTTRSTENCRHLRAPYKTIIQFQLDVCCLFRSDQCTHPGMVCTQLLSRNASVYARNAHVSSGRQTTALAPRQLTEQTVVVRTIGVVIFAAKRTVFLGTVETSIHR